MHFHIAVTALAQSLLIEASPALPVTDLAIRDLTTTPICPDGTGSKVLLTSGASAYTLFVGADKQNYTLIGPDESLGCIGPLVSKYSQCLPCNFPVNKIQVNAEAQACNFRVSGHQDLLCHEAGTAPLVLRSPGQVLDIQCGLDDCPSTHQRKDVPLSIPIAQDGETTNARNFMHGGKRKAIMPRAQPKCDPTRDGYYLTLASGNKAHLIYLPADKNTYTVNGDKAQYGCTTIDHNNCGPCDLKYDAIHVGEGVEACYLTTSESTQILKVTAENSPEVFQNGQQGIDTIACTAKANKNDRSAPISNALSARKEVSTFTAVPISTDPNCPASATWNTFVIVAGGQGFFAPVPLDLTAHPMSEMHCLQDTDSEQAACKPCDEIGLATGVSTKANWGPCIFFTEDHRIFETAYWKNTDGTGTMPITSLNPVGIISLIECGTGAR